MHRRLCDERVWLHEYMNVHFVYSYVCTERDQGHFCFVYVEGEESDLALLLTVAPRLTKSGEPTPVLLSDCISDDWAVRNVARRIV